jgi:sec-independent protein translocase protein TatA
MIETILAGGMGSNGFVAFGMPGGAEWILIAAFGLLIFGKRLPEVGRSLGKGIVEFKKGLKGVEDEIDEQSNKSSRSSDPPHQFDPYTGKPKTLPQDYKFDPHTGKPVDGSTPASGPAASESANVG